MIKVRGRARLDTFEEDGRRGVKVKPNHLIAYAVGLYRESGRFVVWAEGWGASPAPARCDVVDGYIHPYYDDSPPDKVAATGSPVDPYMLEDEPSSDDGCQVSQGT